MPGSAFTASGTSSHRSGLQSSYRQNIQYNREQLLRVPELVRVFSPYFRRSVQQTNRNEHQIALRHPVARVVSHSRLNAKSGWEYSHRTVLCKTPCLSVKGFCSGISASCIAMRWVPDTGAYRRRASRTTPSRYGKVLICSIVGESVGQVRNSARSLAWTAG